MIYIFSMDNGRMMTFDMSLGFDSVQSLMQAIERQYAIPVLSQVLLISGGETLDPSKRVVSYSAGTDTNPIFMFSRDYDVEQTNLPAPWPNIENETDLKSEVDRCLDLPAEYKTVVKRAQLAQNFLELAKEELHICDKLVHEQHLQHQGWMAVIANMEDITTEFMERCGDFDKVFKDHIEKRSEYKSYLQDFDDDLQKLADIPILPPLIQGAEEQPCHAFDNLLLEDTKNSFTTSNLLENQNNVDNVSTSNDESNEIQKTTFDEDKSGQMTLLQWISSNENQKTLKVMAESCNRELDMFEKNVMDTLKDDIEKTVEGARRDDFKEIKGIEDRLQGLEKLMFDAKKIVTEQTELALAFQQNQSRAANLGDQSILPDLCASHKNQLLVLLKNHKKLRDIRNRCGKSKDELGKNLYQRLKFVILIENKMYDIDSRLLFYHTCLRRLQKHLGIIEQVHQAPCVYVQAVTEVVRRRIFSTAFLMWASDLARHLLTIYNDEVLRRQNFRFSFDGHFLNTLFPGIEDFPPKFATEAPSVFDSDLPKLSKNDLEELSKHLPDLTKKIQLPNLSAIVEFFSSRSSHSNPSSSSKDSKDSSSYPSNKKFFNFFAQMKEFERGFDSETDTEEYEKIGQTSIDRQTKQANTQSMCIGTEEIEMKDESTEVQSIIYVDNEMMTDDNMQSGLEVEKLRNIIKILHQTTKDSILSMKQQIELIKCDATSMKQDQQQMINELLKSYEDLKRETSNHERELEQRLTVDHELEMNDLKKILLEKDDEIHSFNLEIDELKRTISFKDKSILDVNEQCRQKVEELDKQIQQMKEKIDETIHEKDLKMKETCEKLKSDHKNEIESLRCKFKLMTSMERSPSDTSLERIERPDMIDITTHETMMKELKEKHDEEMKIVVKNVIEKEREKIMAASTGRLSVMASSSSPGKSPKDSSDIFRRILDEKDKQLEQMREREQIHVRESMKLKETIQSLTDIELNESQVSLFKEKLESKDQIISKLEKDLEKEKMKRAKLCALTQENSGVTINSCSKDDIVLIVWNSLHEQYTIVQDSSVLYFLHADSHSPMRLLPKQDNDSTTRTSFCIGKVTDKEYCHAKKDENRYKVSKGTKFYRVKTRPRSPVASTSSSSEKKNTRKSSDVNELQKSTTKLERQPSILTDSYSQTEMKIIDPNTVSTIVCSDMVDSGVDSQEKSLYKERNISVTEDDEECFSFEEKDVETKPNESDKDDNKEPEDALMLLHNQGDLTSLNDSDDYRSLEEGKDEDTEL